MYLAHKVAKETLQLLENPEVKVMMAFVIRLNFTFEHATKVLISWQF